MTRTQTRTRWRAARDRYGRAVQPVQPVPVRPYAIEGLQIAAETDNPLEAAVQSYVFGEVTESAETGDTLSASANEDTILIGTGGKTDDYVIDMAGAEGNTEAWITAWMLVLIRSRSRGRR